MFPDIHLQLSAGVVRACQVWWKSSEIPSLFIWVTALLANGTDVFLPSTSSIASEEVFDKNGGTEWMSEDIQGNIPDMFGDTQEF